MSYNPETGIISANDGVSIRDVQRALGVGSGDLGTLCTHPNINVWAKYKPISLATMFPSEQWDSRDKCWKPTATWWKGSDPNFPFGGMNINGARSSSFSSVTNSVFSKYDGSMNGWVFQRPRGGQVSPYRLTDFAQYNHKAEPPLIRFSVPSSVKKQGKFDVSCILCDDSMAWQFRDFKYKDQMLYFGIGILDENDSNIKYRITASTRGVAGFMVTLPSSIDEGTYHVYPFFSTARVSNDTPTDAVFLTVPMLNFRTMNVGTNRPNVAFKALYTSSAKTSVVVTITNNDTGNRTIGLHLRLPDATGFNKPEMRTGAGEQNGGTVTVNMGTSETYQFDNLNPNQRYVVWAHMDLDVSYDFEIFIMMEQDD